MSRKSWVSAPRGSGAFSASATCAFDVQREISSAVPRACSAISIAPTRYSDRVAPEADGHAAAMLYEVQVARDNRAAERAVKVFVDARCDAPASTLANKLRAPLVRRLQRAQPARAREVTRDRLS